MAEKSIAQKLLIKPGYTLLVLNAPPGYLEQLAPLPDNVTVATERGGTQIYDAVQVFTFNRADVENFSAPAVAAVKPTGLLWFAYPKKTGSIKTDIHRDVGWESIQRAGWEGVSLISIDNTWSCMRYRPTAR